MATVFLLSGGLFAAPSVAPLDAVALDFLTLLFCLKNCVQNIWSAIRQSKKLLLVSVYPFYSAVRKTNPASRMKSRTNFDELGHH